MAEIALATRVETRMGSGATERVLTIANEPWRLEGDPSVVPAGTKGGHDSFTVKVDDDGGWRLVHLRVWRGRGGLGAIAARLRASPGLATWAAAAKLAEAQIPIPRPLLAAERRSEWSCYACEHLDATVSLEDVLQQAASWSEVRQTKFVRNLAAALRPLKSRRLGFADLSPSALLVRGVPDFEFELLVRDVLGARLGSDLPRAQIESRVLFGFPSKVVQAFFQAYGA